VGLDGCGLDRVSRSDRELAQDIWLESVCAQCCDKAEWEPGKELADTLDGAADTVARTPDTDTDGRMPDTDDRTKAGFALETTLVGPVGVSSGNSTGWIFMRIMALSSGRQQPAVVML
jgi:hypothetical protein